MRFFFIFEISPPSNLLFSKHVHSLVHILKLIQSSAFQYAMSLRIPPSSCSPRVVHYFLHSVVRSLPSLWVEIIQCCPSSCSSFVNDSLLSPFSKGGSLSCILLFLKPTVLKITVAQRSFSPFHSSFMAKYVYNIYVQYMHAMFREANTFLSNLIRVPGFGN